MLSHHVEVDGHKDKPLTEVLRAQSLDCLWCVRQPMTVCAHVKTGDWHELLICFGMASDYTHQPFTSSVCLGYVTTHWLALATKLDAEKDQRQDCESGLPLTTKLALHADRLDEIKALIRRAVAADVTLGNATEAARCVNVLESWACTLRGGSNNDTQHYRFSVEQVLHFFLSSRLLRNSGKVREVCRYTCEALWPGLFEGVERSAPSASTARRAQGVVDVGLILVAQAKNAVKSSAPKYYRWGYSDSSPIRKRNWLVSKHVATWRARENMLFLHMQQHQCSS
eukprot:4606566-Amphidinium_carterae.2